MIAPTPRRTGRIRGDGRGDPRDARETDPPSGKRARGRGDAPASGELRGADRRHGAGVGRDSIPRAGGSAWTAHAPPGIPVDARVRTGNARRGNVRWGPEIRRRGGRRAARRGGAPAGGEMRGLAGRGARGSTRGRPGSYAGRLDRTRAGWIVRGPAGSYAVLPVRVRAVRIVRGPADPRAVRAPGKRAACRTNFPGKLECQVATPWGQPVAGSWGQGEDVVIGLDDARDRAACRGLRSRAALRPATSLFLQGHGATRGTGRGGVGSGLWEISIFSSPRRDLWGVDRGKAGAREMERER